MKWMYFVWVVSLAGLVTPVMAQSTDETTRMRSRVHTWDPASDTEDAEVILDAPERVRTHAFEYKIADRLLDLRDRLRQSRADGEGSSGTSLSRPSLRVSNNGRIQVYVHVTETGAGIRAALANRGLVEDRASASLGIIQGWVSEAALDRIARLEAVSRITEPSYGRPRCSGSACTEGDAIHKANIVRSLGFDGTGVKVGCISDGVDSLNLAVLAGELPAGIQVHPTMAGSGDEGIAVMEIVHDLAPGADLAFAGVATTVEMVDAITWLATTAGVDVIIDDIGFYGEPYFADGGVAQAVRDAVQNEGVVYVTAAGNDCGFHYQGDYVDRDGFGSSTLHDFKLGVDEDTVLNVDVFPGETLDVFLQWDDPFGASGNDYDLIVIDAETSVTILGVGGRVRQTGTEDPVERIIWENTTAEIKNIGILVNNFEGDAADRTLEIFSNLPFGDDDANCDDSIFGHAAVTEAIACTAIDSGLVGHGFTQGDSSQGPSTLRFPSTVVRDTPFLAAVDNVEVSGTGSFPTLFGGTSAAAPHVAAISALLLDIVDHSYTPVQVMTALADATADIDDAGYDFSSGFGRVDALLTYFDLFPPECCPTTISSYPYVEDFESESTCMPECGEFCTLTGDWFNEYPDIDGDKEDWIVFAGPTPSSDTGPPADHTTGAPSGKYLYTEVSSALCAETASLLLSPCFDLTPLANPELRFWYHMDGASMGVLTVEVSENDCDTWTPVFTISGDQGDQWLQGVVDLAPFGNDIRIRFVGQRGLTFSSDLAIDDISIGEACTPPSPPTQATFTLGNFCPDPAGVELQATGGANGDVHWYETGCGIDAVGTGDTIRVPAADSPITYYARRENACGASSCVSVLVPADTTAPTLASAVSRVTHGAMGSLDLSFVPGVFTSEPRTGGPESIILTFSEALMAADGSVDANDEIVIERDGAPDAALIQNVSHTCDTIEITLNSVPDKSCLRFVLSGLQDAASNAVTPAGNLELAILEGDADNSGGVTVIDLSTIKSKLGQTLDATTLRADIGHSGGITVIDLSECKAQLGNSVPCQP